MADSAPDVIVNSALADENDRLLERLAAYENLRAGMEEIARQQVPGTATRAVQIARDALDRLDRLDQGKP